MKKTEFNRLDNTIESFEFIKQQSEKHWENIKLSLCWGYQIQRGSKWKKGLSEEDLLDFQHQVGLKFPTSLKNYFKTMNGLDKLGLNNYGGEEEIDYASTFYHYPEDIEKIKGQINWILEKNNVPVVDFESGKVPSIFPYLGHRFLICDTPENVLSMYGNDIIFWAANLSQGIATDIFKISEKTPNAFNENLFWHKKVQ